MYRKWIRGSSISDNGNLLMNVAFNDVKDIYELNNSLLNICGVIEIWLFTNVITKAIISNEKGIRVISKN